MQTHQLARTFSLIKFPLMALLGLLATDSLIASPAIAGSAPVSLPDSSSSGVSDSFAPPVSSGVSSSDSSSSDSSSSDTSSDDSSPRISSAIAPARIGSGVVTALRTIQSQQFVRSVNGQTLAISPQQVSTISSVLSATGSELTPAISGLEQQLSAELGDVDLDISLLGSSTGDLSTAIAAANEFILSLNSAQLAAAIESPTFMAMLGLLGGANQALANDSGDTVLVEGGAAVGIPLLGLL